MAQPVSLGTPYHVHFPGTRCGAEIHRAELNLELQEPKIAARASGSPTRRRRPTSPIFDVDVACKTMSKRTRGKMAREDRVVIDVGGTEFTSSVSTLSASPYFAALFSRLGDGSGDRDRRRHVTNLPIDGASSDGDSPAPARARPSSPAARGVVATPFREGRASRCGLRVSWRSDVRDIHRVARGVGWAEY